MKYLLCLLLIFSGCKVSNEGGITINANTEKSAGSSGDTAGGDTSSGGSSSGGDTAGGGSSSGGDTTGGDTTGGGSSSGGDTSGGGSSSGGDTTGGGSSSGGDSSSGGGSSSGGDSSSGGGSSSGGDSNGGGNSSAQTGNFKRTLTLTNGSSSSVDDVTFRVELDTASLITSGKMNSDCSDIRMVHEGVQLSTWVGEESCNTNKTDIFFKIPSFAVGETTVDLFYGDLTLTSIHNGDTTFPLYFDDYNRASLLEKTFNGESYNIVKPDGTSMGGMGSFSMQYNSSTTKGKLRMGSNNVSNGYSNQFYVNINKTDNDFIILGSKVKWLTTGYNSYVCGGMIFNGASGHGAWKYTDYTFLHSPSGLISKPGEGVISSGVDYHTSLELLENGIYDRCWKNCSWTVSTSNLPAINAGIFKLGFMYTKTGNSYEIDYYFARRTLPSGDPVITVGAEVAN